MTRKLIRSRGPLLAAALSLAASCTAADWAGPVSGTWTAAESPHRVTAPVTVPAGATLVVEAGAVVLFDAGTSLVAEGVLRVEGERERPVVVRPTVPSAPAGEFEGLVLAGTLLHELVALDLEGARTGVRLAPGGKLELRDSIIGRCLEDGLVLDDGSSGSVRDCAFMANGGAGCRVGASAPLLSGCHFGSNRHAVVLRGNAFPRAENLTARFNAEHDGLHVDTAAALTAPGFWWDGGLPYVIDSGETLLVDTGSTLLLSPGATVKLGTTARVEVRGTIAGLGRGDARCVLTSLADDGRHDTNRDGAASTPQKGDWSGIDVLAGGTVNLVATEVRHADDGLRVQPAGTAILMGCEISECLFRGAAFGLGANGVLEETAFHDNDVGVQVLDASGVAMGRSSGPGELGGRNVFRCHAAFDVENLDALPLEARRNLWSTSPPTAALFFGNVDAGSYLGAEPVTLSIRRLLLVEREGDAELRFRWSQGGSCETYQLREADRADGAFGVLARALTGDTLLQAGLLRDGSTRYFLLDAEP